MDVGAILFPEKIPQQVILFGVEGRCFNRPRNAMTPDTEAAILRLGEGYRFIAYSLDITMLMNACTSGIAKIREKIERHS